MQNEFVYEMNFKNVNVIFCRVLTSGRYRMPFIFCTVGAISGGQSTMCYFLTPLRHNLDGSRRKVDIGDMFTTNILHGIVCMTELC